MISKNHIRDMNKKKVALDATLDLPDIGGRCPVGSDSTQTQMKSDSQAYAIGTLFTWAVSIPIIWIHTLSFSSCRLRNRLLLRILTFLYHCVFCTAKEAQQKVSALSASGMNDYSENLPVERTLKRSESRAISHTC